MITNDQFFFMHPILKDIQTFTLDTLFPIECLFCQAKDIVMCQSCIGSLGRVQHQMCIVCHKPSIVGITHAKCQTPHAPNGLLSFLDYHDNKVSEAIIYGKYKFIPSIYSAFGEKLGVWVGEQKLREFFKNFLVVPLPLSTSRKRWRGFNQAELLANTVSISLDIPMVDALIRIRSTKTQKDLKKDQRIKNIEGAFALRSKTPKPWYDRFVQAEPRQDMSVREKNIVLIDDVITTGSTLFEATKALKRNGAKSVWCVTLARD